VKIAAAAILLFLTGCSASPRNCLTYRLQVEANQPLTLEVEESHGREHGVCAYLVYVDGVKTYFRTWENNGAGAVHYFVQIPPTHNDHISVRFANQSALPLSISRLWVFSDFDRWFDRSGMCVPYYIAPTVHLTWSDYQKDLATVLQIKTSLGDHPTVRPAFTTWIPYANLTADECDARIDHVFRLARDLDMPVQLCLDTWWANTPGGKWSDEKYQQRVYNLTQHRIQLSVPNQWSNTPWLTMNDPELNAFKLATLRAAVLQLRSRYEQLLRAHKQHLLLGINLDNEPIYWASGNAGLGPDLLQADFNPSVVADAKHDGITLDPTDGLDRSERMWLSKNLLRYQEMIAATVYDTLGVVGGPDPVRDNIYTQAMMMSRPVNQYPMLDATHPLWETAAPPHARVGGEWTAGSLDQIQAVMHQLHLGRCAVVNAECENNAANYSGVKIGYALGQRYFAPYNYPLDKMDLAVSALRDVTQQMEPHLFEPVIASYRFGDDAWKSAAVQQAGVATKLLANTAIIAAHPATASSPAYLLFKLPQRRMSCELFCRANDFRGRNDSVCIRVFDGATKDAMKFVGQICNHADLNEPVRIRLDEDANFVRIELHANNLPQENLDWCAIDEIRFTKRWPESMTSDLPPQDCSLATLRKQNLLVSWRADAERAISELSNNAPNREDVMKLYQSRDYVDAYHAAHLPTPAASQ
jgi:hypothetical protein